MRRMVFYLSIFAIYPLINSGFSSTPNDLLIQDQGKYHYATSLSTRNTETDEEVDLHALLASVYEYKRSKNCSEYVRCCNIAADQGDVSALNEMGVIHQFGVEDMGRIYVMPNLEQAIKYYYQAVCKDPISELYKRNLDKATEAQEVAATLFAALEDV